ncbi:hypothetical protein MVEN_01411000 [Mycena venus]|uniref:Uncharacterized protein n=1 Tax=Mycena venus TaxID=2733690 RepID=A0A8H6XZ29_9AGAR|nr:hypothetical protein MVEN_01411000 [Mycena venus]
MGLNPLDSDAEDGDANTIYSELFFPIVPGTAPIAFTTKSFWRAFCHDEQTRDVGKVAQHALDSHFDLPKKAECVKLLKEALPSLRLGLSLLDTKKEIPLDVAAFLAGLRKIQHHISGDKNLPKSLSEYDFIPYPNVQGVPEWTGKFPKLDPFVPKDYVDALRLDTEADFVPKRKREETSDESEDNTPAPRKPTGNFSSAREADRKPVKKKVKTEPVDNDGTSSSRVLRHKEKQPHYASDDEEEQRKEKAQAGKARELESRVDKMWPGIKKLLLDILGDRGRTHGTYEGEGKNSFIATISIVHKQGGKKATGVSALGPGDPNHHFEPISYLPIVPCNEVPLGEIPKPSSGCLPCLILGQPCVAHGLGMECVFCHVKKIPSLCDHAMDAKKLALVCARLREITDVIDPRHDSLDADTMEKLAKRANQARNLADDLRSELSLAIRHTFEVAHQQNNLLGTEGLIALLGKTFSGDALEAANNLIEAYNETADPRAENHRGPKGAKPGSEPENEDDGEHSEEGPNNGTPKGSEGEGGP